MAQALHSIGMIQTPALAATPAKNPANLARIKQQAQDFEAVFISQMMENMFADVDVDPMNDGPGKDIFKSMLNDQYGKIIARSGGIGIADHVAQEMIRLQEGKHAYKN